MKLVTVVIMWHVVQQKKTIRTPNLNNKFEQRIWTTVQKSQKLLSHLIVSKLIKPWNPQGKIYVQSCRFMMPIRLVII